MPKTQRRQKPEEGSLSSTDPSPEDQEPVEQEPEPEEEEQQEEPEPEPAPRPRGRKRSREAVPAAGATVDINVRGEAGAARKAMSRLGGQAAPAQKPEDPGEEMGQYLSDPKNMVIVTRLFPRRYFGRRCDKQLEKYQCPISVDDICDDIFERFGGKRFKVTIHPNTPAGEFKPITAFSVENPDTEVPLFPEDVANPSNQEGDPTLVEDNDPVSVTGKVLDDRVLILGKKLRMKEAERALKEMEGEEPPAAPVGDGKVEARLAALEAENNRLKDSIEKKQIEDRWEARFTAMENLIRESKSAKPDTLVSDMLKSADARYSDLMKMITTQNKPAPPQQRDLKDMLGELKDLKEVFGGDDSRVKKLEDRLLEFAIDRTLSGGEGAGDEDTWKVAIKELTPVLKSYVEKKIDQQTNEATGGGKRQITEEEIKKIKLEAAQRAAKELAADWERQGILVRVPQPGAQPPAPAPAPKQNAEGTTTIIKVPPLQTQQAEAAAAPAAPTPQPQPPAAASATDSLPYEEVDGVKVPPSPQSPVYDRKRAVDFVLDSILTDIAQGCPADTFVIGDILDRLDDEILDDLLKISTGPELEALLRPWAKAEKVDAIKLAGEAPAVKSWLTRVVVTAQDEYRRDIAQSQTEAKK